MDQDKIISKIAEYIYDIAKYKKYGSYISLQLVDLVMDFRGFKPSKENLIKIAHEIVRQYQFGLLYDYSNQTSVVYKVVNKDTIEELKTNTSVDYQRYHNPFLSLDLEYERKQIGDEAIKGLTNMVALYIIDTIKYTNAESTSMKWSVIEDEYQMSIPNVVKSNVIEQFKRVNVDMHADADYFTIYANRNTLVNPNAVVYFENGGNKNDTVFE